MKWDRLLSANRLGKSEAKEIAEGRSSFHQDYDRVVFSSAFRRLQDKTQVFPLAKSDYVRTRLTHSLEASCVGRSLGMQVGLRLIKASKLSKQVDASGIGMIVSTACLAHDIGNPPFGHAGEQAICQWFERNRREFLDPLTNAEKADFLKFEGNAQGFRILTRLQHPDNEGGLQLTYATLAAFSKYPTSSVEAGSKNAQLNVGAKKHGFFDADRALFRRVAEGVGLEPKIQDESWCRHPLAYLVEAADDICYSIIDLEDGVRRGHVSFREAKRLLERLINDSRVAARLKSIKDEQEQMSFLRARAIGVLVSEVADCFMRHEAKLVKGVFEKELLAVITPDKRDVVGLIKRIDREKVYAAREVIEVEIPGFNVLGGLLDAFVVASEDVAKQGKKALPKSSILVKLIPDQFLDSGRIPYASPYQRLLNVTDFICGMTDSYAVALYKQISGLSL